MDKPLVERTALARLIRDRPEPKHQALNKRRSGLDPRRRIRLALYTTRAARQAPLFG